jgi:hypothetical protein
MLDNMFRERPQVSGDPDKVIKERLKEEKRLEKQKMKLEKKFRSGKIDEVTYRQELAKIGYVTQKDLVEDFKRMIQEEIDYLESLDVNGQEGAGGSESPPPPPPPPPPPDIGDDPYSDDYMKAFAGEDAGTKAAKKDAPPIPDLDFKPPEDYEPEYEELSEDMADWELDEDDIDDEFEDDADDEDEFEDDADDEDDFIDEDHSHDIDEVPIDRREGVLAYEDIKKADFEHARVMDSYQQATVLGETGKRRRKKKRKAKVVVEEELSEAEKLMREFEKEPEEQLDLDEVFIPDVASTIKSKKVSPKASKAKAPSIMWEADGEDKQWLEKRLLEETARLAELHRAWRMRKKLGGEIPEWEVYRLVKKTATVKKGKKSVKKKIEVWKVRVSEREDKKAPETREQAPEEGPRPRAPDPKSSPERRAPKGKRV